MDETISTLFTRPGPFAAVALDVSLDSEDGARAVEVAARDAATRLQELGAPEDVAEQVRAVLAEPVHEPAPRSRFVVAGPEGVLLDEVLAVETPVAEVSWEPLPDVGRLLAHRASTIPFVLVEVDHRGGDVTTYESLGLEPGETESAGGNDTNIHKVPTGGWSAMRYQKRSEDTWRENAQEVAELAVRKVAEGQRLVVVAGSVESRPQVVEALAAGPADVVELDRTARNRDGGDEALGDDLQDVVLDALRRRHADQVGEVRERLGQGVRSASGVGAVLDAYVLGQAQLVAVDLDAARDETVSVGDHDGLELSAEPLTGPVRADLALLAGAVRTSAEVVFCRREELDGEVAAAVLRWDDGEDRQETV